MRSETNGKNSNGYTEKRNSGEDGFLVGLAAPYRTDNYGTKLQAFALQHFLDRNGIANEIIDYRFSKKSKDPRKLLLPDRAAYKKEKKKKGSYVPSLDYAEGMEKRKAALDAFAGKHLRFSQSCGTLKEAERLAEKKYSAVICGSDQIWLPSHILEKYYTLSFVPAGVKKAAYAPSFGTERIPWYIRHTCASQLRDFDILTAREKSGKELIKKLTGKDCSVVADPVMLLEKEDWEELAGDGIPPVSGKYAVGYFLGNSSGQRFVSRSFAHSKGLKMVTVPGGTASSALDERYTDKALYGLSPFEFVRVIAGADLVFTDSFHGTLFSVIFEKQFFCFERFGEKDPVSTNTRLYSLLESLGIKERLVKNRDMHVRCAGDIDYGQVGLRAGEMRKHSGNILLDAAGAAGDNKNAGIQKP